MTDSMPVRPKADAMRITAILMLCILAAGCVSQRQGTFASGDPEKAEEDYVRLGLAYIQNDRYDRARRHLDRALEINEESAPAIAAKALINQEEGEYDLAEERFRRALDLEPEYTRGRSHFGVFLYNRGRYEEALEQFRKASEDTDYDSRAGVFVNLARTASRLERHDEAADAYKRAMQLQRGSTSAHIGAVTSLIDAGRYAEARPLYRQLTMRIERSRELSHTPESLLAGIRLARESGDDRKASGLAEQLRERFPDSEEYQQYRTMVTDE
ncbi:type IV pilus biogenesis/stability protein PilW [Halovibrio salipaludis]|uniref:Type IV pilus biogenesis/stability protein PilW n=2 Tax=Halovibrio salipaludis TaxID=2032626 RepID=A0A2A2F8G7_9GAMM|nr:type IV pilus biogenesis/stability protein PilW [Halovibrio salipaludis]